MWLEIAQVSITFFSVSNSLFFPVPLFSLSFLISIFFPFTFPSFDLFSRGSSVFQQREEEERERLLYQCEADPTAIHRLPLLSRALQEHRSRGVKDHLLTLSHGCITGEPAVCLLYILSLWPNQVSN